VRVRAAAAGCVLLLAGCGGAPAPENAGAEKAINPMKSMRVDADKLPPRPPKRDPAPKVDLMEEAIDRYEKLMVQGMDNPENADEMLALANLYLQKRGDYKRAAQWYLEYANTYLTAEHPQAGLIYIQLLTCYEKLEDNESIMDTCRQMLRVFPPESQEYLYADKLMRGLDLTERVPLPQPAPPAESEGESAPEGEAATGAAPAGEQTSTMEEVPAPAVEAPAAETPAPEIPPATPAAPPAETPAAPAS
jgi:tetratricopeptide (TPR) repeat protein